MAEQPRETRPETAPQPQVTAVLVNPALTPVTATEGLDQTTPGGRYKVGDRWVTANGEPIKDRDRD